MQASAEKKGAYQIGGKIYPTPSGFQPPPLNALDLLHKLFLMGIWGSPGRGVQFRQVNPLALPAAILVEQFFGLVGAPCGKKKKSAYNKVVRAFIPKALFVDWFTGKRKACLRLGYKLCFRVLLLDICL